MLHINDCLLAAGVNSCPSDCILVNFCFTDVGEHINNVLKIMKRCEVFCLFCRLITTIAVDLIGHQRLVSAKTGHPYNYCFFVHLSGRLIGELIVYKSLRRPSVRQQFQTSSPLKPLGQLNSNFMWRLLRTRERKLFKWF